MRQSKPRRRRDVFLSAQGLSRVFDEQRRLAAESDSAKSFTSSIRQVGTAAVDAAGNFWASPRRVDANLAHSVELKRLCANGTEPMPGKMRGLTIPRPVHVASIEHRGKEDRRSNRYARRADGRAAERD